MKMNITKELTAIRDKLQEICNHLGAADIQTSKSNQACIYDIQVEVCNHYKISFEKFMSGNRSKPVANARAIAIYLVKRKFGKNMTNDTIASMFNCSSACVSWCNRNVIRVIEAYDNRYVPQSLLNL